jgi:hypothetical protein
MLKVALGRFAGRHDGQLFKADRGVRTEAPERRIAWKID